MGWRRESLDQHGLREKTTLRVFVCILCRLNITALGYFFHLHDNKVQSQVYKTEIPLIFLWPLP